MTAVDSPPGFAADPACAGAWKDWLIDAGRWDWPAVLAAVLADPEADGPRGLAALWFAENGDAARAEFIRVQVEAEGSPPPVPRRLELSSFSR
jgi:uncharacterized protein (TIGR02996 family)